MKEILLSRFCSDVYWCHIHDNGGAREDLHHHGDRASSHGAHHATITNNDDGKGF